jgi:hypothetical protein
MMRAEIPHVNDRLPAREALDLEFIRVAINEQAPCGSAGAVRLELVAVHAADRNGPVRQPVVVGIDQ